MLSCSNATVIALIYNELHFTLYHALQCVFLYTYLLLHRDTCLYIMIFDCLHVLLSVRCRTLSIGSPVEDASYPSSRTPSAVVDVTVLTDHPLYPLLFSNIKIFSVGFVILNNDIGIDPMRSFHIYFEFSTYNGLKYLLLYHIC